MGRRGGKGVGNGCTGAGHGGTVDMGSGAGNDAGHGCMGTGHENGIDMGDRVDMDDVVGMGDWLCCILRSHKCFSPSLMMTNLFYLFIFQMSSQRFNR